MSNSLKYMVFKFLIGPIKLFGWMANSDKNYWMIPFATYYRATIADHGVCASFVGLPSDLATMGPDHSRFAAPTFRGHCQTILAATRGRPTVTDSTGAIALQCEDYLRKVSQYSEHKPDGALGSETLLWSTSLSSLDYGMIDSALIAWNMREKRCRQFMADLACT